LTGFSFSNSVLAITSSVSYANADTQKEQILASSLISSDLIEMREVGPDNKSKAGVYC